VYEPVTKKAEVAKEDGLKDVELIEKLKELFDAVEYKIN